MSLTRSWRTLRDQVPVVGLAVAVAASGTVGWVLLYVGVPIWVALIVAVALAAACTALLAARVRSLRAAELLALMPAFALLTWPPLWLIVILVRYWLTGQSVGN